MGSELRLSFLEAKDWLRLCEAVGGVLDSGGEIKVGVAVSSSLGAVAAAVSPGSSRAMAMGAPGWGACVGVGGGGGGFVVVFFSTRQSNKDVVGLAASRAAGRRLRLCERARGWQLGMRVRVRVRAMK